MRIVGLSKHDNLCVYSVLSNMVGYPIAGRTDKLGFSGKEADALFVKLDLLNQNVDYEPTKYEKWMILKSIPVFTSEVSLDIDAITGDTEQDYRDLYQKLLGMWGNELDAYRPPVALCR